MNGRAIKSANQRFNKKRAKLMSNLTKGSDSKTSVKYSRQLNTLSQKPDCSAQINLAGSQKRTG